jgi:hypothetical protein
MPLVTESECSTMIRLNREERRGWDNPSNSAHEKIKTHFGSLQVIIVGAYGDDAERGREGGGQ